MNFDKLTPYDKDYGSCVRTYAKIAFYSEDDRFEPGVFTEQLGYSPTFSGTKGEIRTNSLGRSFQFSRNIWIYSTEGQVQSLDLRHHIDFLLDILAGSGKFLSKLQKSGKVQMGVNCFWCGRGSGGPTLWPEQMRRLVQLDLELSIEIDIENDDDD